MRHYETVVQVPKQLKFIRWRVNTMNTISFRAKRLFLKNVILRMSVRAFRA